MINQICRKVLLDIIWNDHCAYVAAKATELFNLLCRHLYTCSPVAKYRAFHSLVIPILHSMSNKYGIPAPRKRFLNWRPYNSVPPNGYVLAISIATILNGLSHLLSAIVI